jgi:hypothetical protein
MIHYAFARISSAPNCPLLEDDNTELREQYPEFFNKEFDENKLLKDANGNPLKYVLFSDNNDKNYKRYIKLTK